jgi:hypothetical protein
VNVTGRELPPVSLVVPFFIAAPLALLLASIAILRTGGEMFLSSSVPGMVAATHASVLGWLTLSIMGAIYQLGPATMGGRLWSVGVARTQFVLHVSGVVIFVIAVERWDIAWMSIAGSLVLTSFLLFTTNAVTAVRWSLRGQAARRYISVALGFLLAVGMLGITYVGTLEHAWFPITMGRLAGHAHLGLIGWLALAVMGASYQVVPMFQLSHTAKPRFETPALIVTSVATVIGVTWLMTDPNSTIRILIALAFAAGPLLWAADMLAFVRLRARRTPDIQLRGTLVSLAFLGVTVVLGLSAAWGGWEPARVQVAYAVAGIAGWAGTTLVANSFKIVPFLVWFSRYRSEAGVRPVPMLADLTSPLVMNTVLAVHGGSTAFLSIAILLGNLNLVHTAAALLGLSGAAHFLALLAIVVRHPAPRGSASAFQGGVSR